MERVLKENASQDSANSKRVAQGKFVPDSLQGDIASRINNSPQMIAQRKKLQGLFGGTAQLQGAEDEMLQGKFHTAQRVEEEEPLQGKFEAVQGVEEEEPLQGKFAAVQRVEEEEPLQGKFAPAASAQLKEETAAKPNNTGLPDNLKSSIESLSGLSMDNVKVHYNSSQPAQLNALAYAQGSDIHVAPGQEQHLPHEAWHVVQQAQGRVQPTMQMKDGVAVNDDVGLEREADVMGGRAIQMEGLEQGAKPSPATSNDLKRSSHTENIFLLNRTQDKNPNNNISQLKKKAKVTNEYIEEVLDGVGSEELKKQLAFAWKMIEESGGEAFFDDEISKSFGGYDPQEEKLVFRIPEQNFFQWEDTTIEKKGIVIHELTHVAEVVANTGGLNNMGYDMGTSEIMETDLVALDKILTILFEKVESEKLKLSVVNFDSSTGFNKSLYGYIQERLGYAALALQNKKSNFEFPTVVNQIIYVVDSKASEEVKETETYSWLKVLEGQLVSSRENRFFKNAKKKEKLD